MGEIVVKMQNISKVYDNGVVANDNAFIEIERGEIHALAGENGAGKSTLMKILYGLEKPTNGQIFVKGEEVKITSPIVADKLGIGMVHQHFMLVEQLTVAENLILGKEIVRNGLLDIKSSVKLVNKLCKEFNMPIDATVKVSTLSIVQKQKVEILKVLSRNVEIIILDEPTAVLTPQETKELFAQLSLLRNKGYTIVIITHKLKEIKQICDRISIMRNGKYIGTHLVKNVTEEDISRLMVGRDVIRNVEKSPSSPKQIVLKVSNLTKITNDKKAIKNISFNCRVGEIVCIAGVEGNGQREVVQAIAGYDNSYTGEILINEQNLLNKSIKQIRAMGQRHIPEDRSAIGVDCSASISDNLISTRLNEVTDGIFINSRKVAKLSVDSIAKYKIKCDNAEQKVGMLSGGNMQKVVIARETNSLPTLLIADQPTRGVDVGAIEFIHNQLVELRDSGCAVLLISSDLAEVFSLADRILVFCGGEIVANLTDVASLSEEELGKYMLGIKRMAEVTND